MNEWVNLMKDIGVEASEILKIIAQYNADLANCQGQIGAIDEEETGGFGNRTWSYADWRTIRNETKKILQDNGLSCKIWHERNGEKIDIIAEVRHKSGYFEQHRCPALFKIDAGKGKVEHAVCGAITQYKRYIYNGLFGITTAEADSEKKSNEVNAQENPETEKESNWVNAQENSETELPPCPKCNKPLRERKGANGPFYGCSGYPKCKFTLDG